MVRYAAMVFINADVNRQTLGCEHDAENGLCGEPVEYLVPDATRPGGGGRGIEHRPAMFCREHLEEMLGHPPAKQSIFRRIVGSEE